MDRAAERLRTRFFADAEEFLSRGKEIAEELAKNPGEKIDAEQINELFRCVHSVKSEASYLKYQEVGSLANGLEEKLETIRSGGAGAGKSDLADVRDLLGRIEEAVRADERNADTGGLAGQPDFNKFEWKLLTEAVRRGERCYRVVFEIDQDAPMKRARAYLLVSNLEQLATVIRTSPSITADSAADDDEGGGENSTFTCYLTASVPQNEIYEALDVDQVTTVRIEPLGIVRGEQGTGIITGDTGRTMRESASLYRLTGKKLDQLTAYADDLRLRLRELELDINKSTQDTAAALRTLSRVADGLYDELSSVRAATIGEEYAHYQELVHDLAERLGKQVELLTTGGELKLDRRTLTALSDPLSHLLRNAVDHGIEAPQARLAAGKEETGRVSLTAAEEGDQLKITVSDDGTGVDEEQLRRRFEDAGEEAGELFKMLAKPGFTTIAEATDLSGRGVGLDLVARRVEEAGGEIHATSRPGKGVTFEISIPKGPSYAKLLFFRLGSELYALPSQAVVEIRRIGKGELKRNTAGRIFHLSLPAYAGGKPAQVGSRSSFGSYSIVLSYLGRNGCVLADDVLFEHEVSGEVLSSQGVNLEQNRRMAVSFGSERREFNFLPPSMIHPDVS